MPGWYVHLPAGAEAEWVKQLVSEQLVTIKTKRGFSRLEWQKLRERNEALDCRVYARAAAWIAGADRWTEAMWRDLEQQVGSSAPGASEKRTTGDDRLAGVIRRRSESPRPARVSVELHELMTSYHDATLAPVRHLGVKTALMTSIDKRYRRIDARRSTTGMWFRSSLNLLPPIRR